jgi:DNA helicase-2/ATP-dependent DNA helicase PcrA
MAHHTVLYGKALHDAIQHYHQNKIKGIPVNQEEAVKVFEDSFRREGFLSQDHLQLRLKSGYEAIRNFYNEQERSQLVPTYVEKDFSFTIGQNRIIGRWDRVDIRNDKVIIIDFKSSEIETQEDANKRTKESLQLSLYSLAYQRVYGTLPTQKELHFLETGLIGQAPVTEESLAKVIEAVETASSGIRSGDFEAKPTRMVCLYCAYNQICPFAAGQQR